MAARSLSSAALGAARACCASEGGVAGRLTAILARSFSSAAAGQSGGGCGRLLQSVPRAAASAAPSIGAPGCAAATAALGAAAAAAAARSSGLVNAAAGGWRAVSAAAAAAASRQHQQARGFARYLQFQPRSGGGWGGSGGGGWLSNSDAVVKGLIGLNIAGFLLWRVAPGSMHTHATVSIEGLRAGRVWTVLTAAFSHQDLWHLGGNMLGLYFFGRDVGRLFGGSRLLALYLAGAAVGSLAHCGWYYYKACQAGEGRFGRARWFGFTPSALGASAAVNAIMVVDILLFPTRTVLLYGFIPMPAALLGALWLWGDVSGTLGGHSHIAHAGHLGGAATGLAFFLAFKRGLIRPRGWF